MIESKLSKPRPSRQASIIPYLAGLLLIISCGKPLKIEGFNKTEWQKDKQGCLGIRQSLARVLTRNEREILGGSENDVLEWLGKPDRNELYERNQKFLIYDIEPGAGCAGGNKLPETLVIRINATGLCSEIFIQKGFSTR